MIIDTSALVAIVLNEPEAAAFDELIRLAPSRKISTATCVELMIVLTAKLGIDARPVVIHVIDEYELERIAVDEDQMTITFDGVARFGKGRHPARLNLGDCFAYALAKTSGEPLLFKGNDFSRTDVAVA